RLGREEPKAFDLGGDGFYYSPSWSPDGKHVLFNDKGNRIAFVTLETGEVTAVASVQGSLGTVQPTAVWSPDSSWIAFEDRNPRTLYDTIALYELETSIKTTVTDAFAFASNPAFSSDGEHLFFVASTNRGSSLMGLNMSTSASRDWDGSLYVAVLAADGANPLAPRNDEAVDDGDDKDAEDDGDAGDDVPAADEEDGDSEGPDVADSGSADEPEDDVPSIDLEGLGQRILALPMGSGRYSNLAAAGDALLFIERDESGSRLRSFDFDGRKAETLDEGAQGFSVSADGKSLLIASRGGFKITNAKAKDAQSVDVDSMRVRVDPALEWPQTLREVWRIQRDYFYDPNFHGVDWPAMWDRWEPFLAHVQHRGDLTLIIQQLIGELACGHQYVRGGEYPDGPEGISVGLLGADYVVDSGLHRIARIHAGQNWDAGGSSPLTLPGVDVREGDYLLAVDGVALSASDNLYAAFVDTAGKQTELNLSANADGSDPRTAQVVPIGSEWRLRFASWVEANRRRVDEASGGRLAYIYMPDTGSNGMNSFDRDFYSQLDREGLVLDERYNGGGQVADYVIETLERDVMSYWLNREGWVGVSPSALLEGPKVMVINESAGSGGDWMPWAFQRRGLGPLVGTRTWGGLVGISGYPPLMDGGSVTSANFGVMDPEGNWAVENVGVAPDYEVIEWPALVLDGADPQLDRAIELALEALEEYEPRPLPKYVPPTPR
ncbi:MAG: PDZ domain-containing protein, partial [Planctomycetota bacterium]|nr:PDZ domain-containing protein [Planctomycetota bacterium]